MKRKFILCEGLDAAGKTTVIKEALKKLDEKYVYNKGLTSDTIMGKIAPKIPSTLTFLIELVYNTKKVIEPHLERDKIVLQDRYDISVLSHVPKAERCYNKAVGKLFRRFLLKPDMLIYFTVSKDERIRRLKNQEYKKHHYDLIKNPLLIELREKKYLEFYKDFEGIKYKIDTTKKNLAMIVDEFVSKVS